MKGYVRARGPGRWQIAVYIGSDSAGRARYLYETVEGGIRDAERRRNQLVADVEAGRLGAGMHATVLELSVAWWAIAAPRLSPTTRSGYRRLLDVRILPALGRRRVAKIRTDDLERFYAELEAGTAPGGGKLSPRSIRNVHSLLSGMLATAERWSWISTNPARRARLPKLRSRPVTAPDPDQVARLLALARENDLDLGAFLRLAVATGARRGELCALRWSDLDLDAGELTIARSIAPDDQDRRRLLEKDTKTHASRPLSLDAGTVAELRAVRLAQLERAIALGATPDPAGFVFTNDPAAATPWHPDAVTKRFHYLRLRAGAPGVRLHDLRHYHGTMLADLGVPLPTVQARLGHSDIRTTGVYAHGRRPTDRIAADLIGEHLELPSG